MIGNKIADNITSLGKIKSKERENDRQEIYISPEKKQQIIDELRLIWPYIIITYQKITNLLGKRPDKIAIFVTWKWIEVHDQAGNAEER